MQDYLGTFSIITRVIMKERGREELKSDVIMKALMNDVFVRRRLCVCVYVCVCVCV